VRIIFDDRQLIRELPQRYSPFEKNESGQPLRVRKPIS